MSYSAQPEAVGNYQMRTHLEPVKMPNVQYGSFECKVCGKYKAVSGRKSLGHKAGFQCKSCAEAKR